MFWYYNGIFQIVCFNIYLCFQNFQPSNLDLAILMFGFFSIIMGKLDSIQNGSKANEQ